MELRCLTRLIALLLTAGALVAPAAGASFEARISSLPLIVTTNRTLAYTMVVTNVSGLQLNNVIVSSSFNHRINYLSANNSSGTAGIEDGAIVYRTSVLPVNGTLNLTLNLRPDRPGLLTNTVQMTAGNLPIDVTNDVRRIYQAESNLGISLRSPTNSVVVGDWTGYRVSVTNGGPELVSEGTITNLIPAGAQFLSLTPSNGPVTVETNRITFNFSSLASGQTQHFELRLQPNAAALTAISAAVGSPDVFDAVTTNDAVANPLLVVDPVGGGLAATFVTGAQFNPQTGLMEQTIRLTNTSATTIAMSRVQLAGFGPAVFNASGTNSAAPFLTLPRSLAPGESAELLLEYFSATRTAAANPALSAWQVPFVVPAAPAGTVIPITRIVRRDDGSALLEFTATPGATYSIVYGDRLPLTNAAASLPTLTAPANQTQWIDNGAPRTPRPPDQAPARFYQVIRLP